MLHGSNAQSRYGTGAFVEFSADHFARRGISVLTYDKRGVGASTGDWEKASFDDLAADALAGVQFLKSHKGVNPKLIGLWGISQGAWLVELAASRSMDVAFIIPVSGGGVNAELQDIKRTELQMRADVFSEEDIQQAVALQKLKWRFALTGQGWEEYEAAFQKTRDKKWFSEYVGSPSSKDSPAFSFWRSINTFDPVDALKKVICPILVILGNRDTITPVPETISNIEMALKASKNKNYTIKVFPKGDHTLLEAESGGNKERVHLKKFVPGYFDAMADWVLKQMKA
jgi:pimeloyl-ACP methyl ester carboxylesterase